MHKKLLIGLTLLFILIIPFTICYANDDDMKKASDSAKNAVSGAENAVEGAAKNMGNAIQNIGNSIKDGAHQAKNEVKNSMDKTGNNIQNGLNNIGNTMNNNNSDYNATRTAAEGTFMGMTSNTWSWLILGIAAVAIIGLVWYYSVQLNDNKRNKNE